MADRLGDDDVASQQQLSRELSRDMEEDEAAHAMHHGRHQLHEMQDDEHDHFQDLHESSVGSHLYNGHDQRLSEQLLPGGGHGLHEGGEHDTLALEEELHKIDMDELLRGGDESTLSLDDEAGCSQPDFLIGCSINCYGSVPDFMTPSSLNDPCAPATSKKSSSDCAYDLNSCLGLNQHCISV